MGKKTKDKNQTNIPEGKEPKFSSKTEDEEQRAVAEKLKNIMTESMSEEEIKQILSSELSGKDKKKMDEMLKQGFSMEEVLDHFQNRGSENEAKTELARKI